MSCSTFVALVKFRYHITFLNVVFGALIFAPDITAALFGRLAVLYGCFNVLLYGGIYTLNDLADRDADGRHPLKRLRPIASGAIPAGVALAFGLCLIVLGLTTATAFFDADVLACFGAVLLVNAAYSTGGRDIAYLDLTLNAMPHPIRFLMGALLVDRVPRAEHLIAIALIAVAMSCLRRHVEQELAAGPSARPTLGRYARPRLEALGFACLGLLAILSVHSARLAPGFTAIALIAGVVLICGGYWVQAVRAPLRAVWMR